LHFSLPFAAENAPFENRFSSQNVENAEWLGKKFDLVWIFLRLALTELGGLL
jgi:hypothetical protein